MPTHRRCPTRMAPVDPADVAPLGSDDPTEPTAPWAPPSATTPPSFLPPEPPTAPGPPSASAPPLQPASGGTSAGGASRRPSGWRQFVVGAVVGALVGGGTAAGVAVATQKNSTTTRTVVVGPSDKPVRNTSVINQADDVQSVLAKVDGAVVAIQTGAAVDQGLFSGGSNNSSGAEGTGFVVSPDGVIVTNSHVVEGANGRIEVEFSDGTKEAADLLGRAPEYDLAVLKVHGKNLPTAKLGSSDDLEVGDQVVAVGNALGAQGRPQRHPGHRLGQGSGRARGRDRRDALRHAPDRRGHQPGQLRWTARERGGPGRRHQHRARRATARTSASPSASTRPSP